MEGWDFVVTYTVEDALRDGSVKRPMYVKPENVAKCDGKVVTLVGAELWQAILNTMAPLTNAMRHKAIDERPDWMTVDDVGKTFDTMVVSECLTVIAQQAKAMGPDTRVMQVEDVVALDKCWFVENSEGGYTAILPSEY